MSGTWFFSNSVFQQRVGLGWFKQNKIMQSFNVFLIWHLEYCLTQLSPISLFQTNPGPIKAASSHSEHSAAVYCYNCSRKGHFGYVSLSNLCLSAGCTSGIEIHPYPQIMAGEKSWSSQANVARRVALMKHLWVCSTVEISAGHRAVISHTDLILKMWKKRRSYWVRFIGLVFKLGERICNGQVLNRAVFFPISHTVYGMKQ